MTFKVLLIDDEPGALEGMQLWIDWTELGFEVCGTCSNGVEGLRMIQELKPDLVVTDVNMPLMDGLQMIENWKNEEVRHVKFAIISGYSEFEYAQKAMRYGINHYLLKPVIPEEAVEELREIHEELVQDTEEQQLTEIASYEEVVSFIREAMHTGVEENTELYNQLSGVSARCEKWNCCLIQTESETFPEVRAKVASLLYEKGFMYLIDLELNSLCVVYGYSSLGGEDSAIQLFMSLLEECSEYRLMMATGACEDSLLHISMCYESAREAIKYKFYDTENGAILSYEQVIDQPFSYHYDQLQVMEEILRSIMLLDFPEFQKAVSAADHNFRQLMIAPEIVKKVVIHVLHRMLEVLEETTRAQAEQLLKKYTVPELSGSIVSLSDLMNTLRSCGAECIHLLLKEQDRQSQGVIQEIMNYIEKHYREKLTLRQLSEIFFIHPVYLGQLLLKKNGIPFNKLLHNLRIEEAKRLLCLNGLKNSEIAEELGYSHYSQFLKQFEMRVNMSPNEYKNTKIKSF